MPTLNSELRGLKMRIKSRRFIPLVVGLLGLLLAACSQTPSPPGGGGGSAQGFTISLSPTSLNAQQGGNTTTELTITPQGGFSGDVDLSVVDGTGQRVSWISLNPSRVSVIGPLTRNLTVTVAPQAPVGTHTLTLRGTAGNQMASTTLNLTVTAPPLSGLWTRQFGSSSDDYAYGVALDGSGNIVVVGYTWGTLPGNGQTWANPGWTRDAFVRKYDPSGGP